MLHLGLLTKKIAKNIDAIKARIRPFSPYFDGMFINIPVAGGGML